jgi:hypothetical protein
MVTSARSHKIGHYRQVGKIRAIIGILETLVRRISIGTIFTEIFADWKTFQSCFNFFYYTHRLQKALQRLQMD